MAEVVVLITADGVTFEGFEVTGGGVGIQVDGHHGNLENNSVHDTQVGIVVNGDDNTIEDNHATASGFAGFIIDGNSNEVEGNESVDNIFGGMGVFGSDNHISDNLCSGNESGYGCGGSGNVFEDNGTAGSMPEGLCEDDQAGSPSPESARSLQAGSGV